jgi:hypothetical protein
MFVFVNDSDPADRVTCARLATILRVFQARVNVYIDTSRSLAYEKYGFVMHSHV